MPAVSKNSLATSRVMRPAGRPALPLRGRHGLRPGRRRAAARRGGAAGQRGARGGGRVPAPRRAPGAAPDAAAVGGARAARLPPAAARARGVRAAREGDCRQRLAAGAWLRAVAAVPAAVDAAAFFMCCPSPRSAGGAELADFVHCLPAQDVLLPRQRAALMVLFVRAPPVQLLSAPRRL